MKLAILAASLLIGVAFQVPAFAQGSNRVQAGASQADETQVLGRTAPPLAHAPSLDGDRPAAGAVPLPPGQVRSYTTSESNEPVTGANLQRSLRAD